MDIPRGFNQFNALGSANASVSATAGRLDNTRREFNQTLSAAGSAAQTWGRISAEKQHKAEQLRTRKNDAEMRLAFARASTAMTERTAGREVTPADLQQFEQEFLDQVSGLDLTDDERELAQITAQEYRARAEEEAVEYNLRLRQAQTEQTVKLGVQDLVDMEQFDTAAELLEKNQDLYTPAEYESAMTELVKTREHSRLVSLIGSGTEAELKRAQSYANSLLTSDAVPASMRSELHATLTAQVNRIEAQRNAQEAEAEAAFKEARSDFVARLRTSARYGEPDEETGTLLFVDRDEVEQYFDSGLLSAEERHSLLADIEARKKSESVLNRDLAIMAGAADAQDPLAYMRASNPNKTATEFAKAQLPSWTDYSQWAPEDKARLVDMVSRGWVPDQVQQTLKSGIAVGDVAVTASALSLWQDLNAKLPYYAATLPDNVRAHYNSITELTYAGVPAEQAIGVVRERMMNKPDTATLAKQYKQLNGATPDRNADWLANRFLSDDELVRLSPGKPSGLFGDDALIRRRLADGFDALVRESYYMTEDMEAARENAYQTLRNIVRPSRFNGELELAVAPPEFPPGSPMPLDPDVLRKEFDDDVAAAGITVGEDEKLIVAAAPGVVLPNGTQVYFVHRLPKDSKPGARGEIVVDENGEPWRWSPDYSTYSERRMSMLEPQGPEARQRAATARKAQAESWRHFYRQGF